MQKLISPLSRASHFWYNLAHEKSTAVHCYKHCGDVDAWHRRQSTVRVHGYDDRGTHWPQIRAPRDIRVCLRHHRRIHLATALEAYGEVCMPCADHRRFRRTAGTLAGADSRRTRATRRSQNARSRDIPRRGKRLRDRSVPQPRTGRRIDRHNGTDVQGGTPRRPRP